MTTLTRASIIMLVHAAVMVLSAQTGRGQDLAAQGADTEPSTSEVHPTVRLGRAIKLQFTARIESDLRGPTATIGLVDPETHWQDRRIGLRGDVGGRVHFEIERELSEDFDATVGLDEISAWRDVYVDVEPVRHLNVRAGRFKLPLGHEELIGETNLDFVHRSLAARILSPGRDIGLMAHGRLFKRVLSYEVGYFGRDGANGRTDQTEGGRDARTGRLVVAPFARSRRGALASFTFGGAAVLSNLENRLGTRGRTAFGDGVFFDRSYVNGRRERAGVELAWTAGPVGLSAERITLSEQRTGMGFLGQDLTPITAVAWSAAATWTLTGEPKHGRVYPRKALFRGGAGAVEIAARLEELRFDAATYPTVSLGYPNPANLAMNADRVLTAGVNWYVNRYFKAQFNVVRESIDDPQRSPAPGAGGRFTSVVLRMQVRL